MRDRVKEIINFILPLSIGTEVYVKSALYGKWIRGKIVDRFYSKVVGWCYEVKLEKSHGNCFVTINSIRLLEREGYEEGREESN